MRDKELPVDLQMEFTVYMENRGDLLARIYDSIRTEMVREKKPAAEINVFSELYLKERERIRRLHPEG